MKIKLPKDFFERKMYEAYLDMDAFNLIRYTLQWASYDGIQWELCMPIVWSHDKDIIDCNINLLAVTEKGERNHKILTLWVDEEDTFKIQWIELLEDSNEYREVIKQLKFEDTHS